MRNYLLAVLVLVFLTGISFPQQSQKSSAPLGVFAYANTSRHLVALSNELDALQANLLSTAVCPTHKSWSEVTLTPGLNDRVDDHSAFAYDAKSDVPARNYCLLVDEKAHPNLFTWGSGDDPLLVHKACLGYIVQAAERLTGRSARTCYLIGGYGTGRVDLVEFVSDSPGNKLAALLMTDDSLDGSRYSIVRFPANSPVWSLEKDGKFHPERFHHLFTISDNPESKVWTIAVDWAGPSGHTLTLYQPKDGELRPVLVNHDSSRRRNVEQDDLALR